MRETPAEDDPPRPTDDQRERKLSPAALRALAEAAGRRAAAHKREPPAKEIGGRGGLEPVRYGDWEKNGIASDF